MEKRRDFLKTAGAFAAGSIIVPFGCSPKKASVQESETVTKGPKNIGIQIYTLRNEIGQDGVEAVLEKVAAAGYKWIEPYGYENRKFLDKTPTEFKQILTNLGLAAPSVHSVTEVSSSGGKDAIIDQMKTTADDALAIGAEYLVWAYLKEEDRQSMDDYKRHIETWNKFGEVCKEAGIQFAYHNHDFEFMEFDGVKAYDVIMKETDPDNVKFELDLYWITKSGNDPVEYFKKDPGRFHLWHVKDMYPEDQHFAPVGKGKIDFEKIFNARETSGMKYFFVEQDATREGVSPLDTMKVSWDYLNNADFV
jgi:sugar phosphate isomerase/epimerase